ncbi:hypothetical protein [Roseicitreum antarcticum]|uniref:Uncharacterized protein n=1 Tax=Roseicitreum antarcticum TaxID=564137 RepID=A0A1H2WH79_9RHOB|nr:hypothetical protein [Roseicitreum antarcticum]SDW79369.1 hypothetical protein SAMN04488238_103368 [Roseicitreum antarcticum]
MAFHLSKRDAIKILFSETVGWKLGMPLVGLAVSQAVTALDHLLNNTAELRLADAAGQSSDEFLNQHPLPLQALYDREKLLRGRLLYVEMANFIDLIVRTGRVHIDIAPRPEGFRLAPFADPGTEALRNQGFERLREVGKYRHNSNVIRLERVDVQPGGARLHIQRATYHDQASSNLILDFVGNGRAPTLREALRRESPGRLPDLDDRRLANSLGVTVLVFYRDARDNWTPFLVPRTRATAVLNRGLWSDSASGAAQWPKDAETAPKTFDAYILDDLHQEMESEIGLFPEDLTALLPLAIGREIMRAGKPQMFFIGFTQLSRPQLLKRMETARKKNLRNPIEPEEIYRMPLLRRAPTPDDPSQIHAVYEDAVVDPQCAASLYYALSFLNRLTESRHAWLS